MRSLSASKICIFVQSVDYHFLSGVSFFFWLNNRSSRNRFPKDAEKELY